MFKTLFRRQMASFLLTLVLAFVSLGVVLSYAFSSYLVDQKKTLLIEQSERIAEIYYQYSFLNEEKYSSITLEREWQNIEAKLQAELSAMRMYLSANCFFTDKNMKVTICSSDISFLYMQKITETELTAVLEGGVVVYRGTMGGVLSETHMIAGYPIIVGENVTGAAFVSAPTSDVDNSIADMIVITLLALCVAAVMSFILIYITSMKITKPILEMNAHAKEIASGDFFKRIYVKSGDEIGQLAQSFNDMAESLQKQEERRREFISNISHDLRSPLTSMTGFVKAILDGTIPEEKQKHYLDIVLTESERLSKLANDLLDINKIRNLGVELIKSRFDINELIRTTVIMFENRINDKNIDITVSFANETDYVYADYDKIQRVLYNLMDNAVKFTKDGGSIDVETKELDGQIKINVRDDGIGIGKEEQKRIFERFYKGDASRGEYTGGSGLGLSIVKEFVAAHESQLQVKSDVGQGCEISFMLDLSGDKS